MTERAIAEWLAEIGLSQLASLFDAHEVGFDVLDDLTEPDLEKMGIALGTRKRLLKAIAARRMQAPAVRAECREEIPQSIPASGDRRQLTVMFCDLVGSTELSQRLDPEELRGLIRQYQDVCVRAVGRFGGHVAQYLGDGILVYFGYPQAMEGGAERAIRAALAILSRERVSDSSKLPPMRVRIGIDTGVVVIGEQHAFNEQERFAIGDAPNLAARLQSLAQPDTIVVSERTRVLAAGAFDFEDMGAHSLKGILQPVHCWRVLHERRLETRFDARLDGIIGPMVGREIEFSVAQQAWQRAGTGTLQMLLLCGEPGIGKSRTVRALRDSLVSDAGQAWQYQCSSHFINSALYPVIGQIELLLGMHRDMPADERLARLETHLGEHLHLPALDIALIGHLLGLAVEARISALAMSTQKLKDETLRAIGDMMAARASEAPLLLLFEDMHWADPTTLEALDLFLRRARDTRALVVLSYRPEFKSPWVGQAGVISLTLGHLDKLQVDQIATFAARGKRLPPEVLTLIAAKTDGVPLFVEELTKAIIESNVVKLADDRYELTGPISSSTIPSTLRDSLVARLDRLGSARDVAQIAACIGREFGVDLLAHLTTMSAGALDENLRRLTDSELVSRRGAGTQTRYVFKHALIQDAAYDSLLKSRRAELTDQIARTLEAHFPERVSNEPELMAHYWFEAGQVRKAIEYWRNAGSLASSKSASQEAVAHYRRAAMAVNELAPGADRNTLEAEVQVALGFALMPLKGWTASEVRTALARGQEICLAAQDFSRTHFLATWGLAAWHLLKGELAKADHLAMQGSEIAARVGDKILLPEASWLWGNIKLRMGNLLQARHILEDGLRKYDPDVYAGHPYLTGQDPKVAGQFFLTELLWGLGHADLSLRLAEKTRQFARDLNHPFSLAWGLNVPVWSHVLRHEWSLTIPAAQEMIQLCEREGFAYWAVWPKLAKGIAMVMLGDHGPGVELIESVDSALEQLESMEWVTLRCMYRAKTYVECGRLREAEQRVERGIGWVVHSGEAFYHSELLRLRGELALRGQEPNVDFAERCFREAIAVAQSQSADGWRLICSESLARLLARRGRYVEAREVLTPAVDAISEGRDTPAFSGAIAFLSTL